MEAERFRFLPATLLSAVNNLSIDVSAQLEELRVREGRPLEVVFGGKYRFLSAHGTISSLPEAAYYPTREDCARLLDSLSNHSLYALDEELRRGYITIRGGHRIGVVGKTVLDQGQVKYIKDIAGFNIRMAREVRGASRLIMPMIVDRAAETVYHSLLISPPQHGKTTVLRELARSISSGEWGVPLIAWEGRKVGIVDERSELAACYCGVPTFDVGPRTDVLDGCPKAEGMMMMIRAMSPDVLVVDEIGRQQDVEAMEEALHAGIRIVASAHGRSYEDIKRRPLLRTMLERRLFDRIIVLNRQRGGPLEAAAYLADGRPLSKDARLVERREADD